MSRPSIFDDLTERTDISRQRKWALRRRRLGLCGMCGKAPIARGSAHRCAGCGLKHRIEVQLSRKDRPPKKKRKGGVACPPLRVLGPRSSTKSES